MFLVQNHFLNLCSSAVDSERLLCSQKAGGKYISPCSFETSSLEPVNNLRAKSNISF